MGGKFGAGNETRTRDPNLGKVVLYQLSYSRLTLGRLILKLIAFLSSAFDYFFLILLEVIIGHAACIYIIMDHNVSPAATYSKTNPVSGIEKYPIGSL